MKPQRETRPPVAAATDLEIGKPVRRPDGTVVLHLGGHLDVDGSPRLQEALTEQLRRGARQVELDCTEVGFISSVGVGALIVAVGEFREVGGDIAVAGLNEELRHMFAMLELTDYVTLR